MSHTYLIDLFELIDQRLEEVMVKESSLEGSAGTGAAFQKGRVEVLTEFKQFLAAHYNSKLPRRLKQKYS
jgi:hypothetical protein